MRTRLFFSKIWLIICFKQSYLQFTYSYLQRSICSTHVLQISMVSPVPFQECTEDHTQWLRWRAGSDWHCASQRPPQRWFGDCCQKLKLQKIASKKNRWVPIAPVFYPHTHQGSQFLQAEITVSRSAEETRRPALAPAQPSAPKPLGIRQKSGGDQQRCWLNHWNTHG